MKSCIGTREAASLGRDGEPAMVAVAGISLAAAVGTSASKMPRAIRLLEPVVPLRS